MSNTLLPCPFCGGEVSIALCGDGFDAWWFITRGHGENACKCRLFMESEKFNNDSEMADFVADDLIAAWNRRADARQLALKTRVCPMCEDCPDGCPIETPKDSRNKPENEPLTLGELRQMDGEQDCAEVEKVAITKYEWHSVKIN